MWGFNWVLVFCGIVLAQNDFIPTNFEEITQSTLDGFGAEDKCGEGVGKGIMHCVPYHRCDPETNTTIPDEEESLDQDYGHLIDVRFGTKPCEKTLDVCCKIGQEGQKPSSPLPPTPSTQGPTVSSPSPSTPSLCGIRNINGVGFKITGNSHNEAEYGEFPWMVAILKIDYNPAVDTRFIECGGSLIAPRVVLTGAHCIKKYKASELKVRAGEWDTQTTDERFPFQERNVVEIIIHEQYKERVLYNDVALLVLETPVLKDKHIGTVCLPNEGENIDSRECYATGWGKNVFGSGGHYQQILKKIQLPIVARQRCEAELKKTRLGNLFKLHNSFICAGGEAGKDTCTGDGGSPLVCPDPKNPSRYVQAGIVAWGIDCGTGVPGVYANVAKFRNWVDSKMQRLNLSNKPYSI